MPAKMFRFKSGNAQFVLLYWKPWVGETWAGAVYHVPQNETREVYKGKVADVSAASVDELKQKAVRLSRITPHS